MTAAGGAISSVVLELSSHYSGAKQRSHRQAIGIQRGLEQGCYRTLSGTLVRTLAKNARLLDLFLAGQRSGERKQRSMRVLARVLKEFLPVFSTALECFC